MRTPRIYTNTVLTQGAEVTLSTDGSHYLVKVLRMEAGRKLIAFNGDGAEYPSTLISASKKNAVISIDSKEEASRESPLKTHLAIAISRGDRMDWVLQKATELGVTEITPLFTERTEVKIKGDRLQKKHAHWQQIIVSSCEQNQRNTLPKLNNAITLDAFFQQSHEGLKFVLHHRSSQTLNAYPSPKHITLLIGPEGGLTDLEIEQALEQNQYEPLRLGPRILRTETAPITALSVLQFRWGDLS